MLKFRSFVIRHITIITILKISANIHPVKFRQAKNCFCEIFYKQITYQTVGLNGYEIKLGNCLWHHGALFIILMTIKIGSV
jgi:hypothetical protein